MRLLCQLLSVITLVPWLMGADVYRWVDEDGVVNYTEQRPEGVEADPVDAPDGSQSSAAAADAPAGDAPAGDATGNAPAADDDLTPAQQQMLSDLRAAEQARQKEVERIRESNCREAREVHQRLTARGRIRVRDGDGGERVLPEEERQQRIDDAQRGIAENCASP
ncbi:MAG: DUF4124 domain-containing protein [Pseudomonadota bacterium]